MLKGAPESEQLSNPAEKLNLCTKEAQDRDGTPECIGMVRRGGDAARVKALLAGDESDC